MTWIVVSPTIFGYGVGISDIRVALPDGSTRDCLQKIYKVGNDIVVGFSGSVFIGFKMVEGLRKGLADIPEDSAWKPEFVAKEWQKFAQEIYSNAKEIDRKAGCSLVLIGSSPDEKLGDAPFAKTIVAILKAPDFEPKFLKIGQWDGIGSGMGVSVYRKIIEELNDADNAFPYMQMEVGMPRGFGFAIQILISRTIASMPEKSVSRYLHLCTVRPAEIKITGIDTKEYKKDGTKTEYSMPRVATSWEELKAILGVGDEALAGSSCTNFFSINGRF